MVPPFTGVAVNLTEVPEHTGFADAAKVTLTGRIGLTVTVTELEVAGFPDVQIADDVRTQLIIFPVAGANE